MASSIGLLIVLAPSLFFPIGTRGHQVGSSTRGPAIAVYAQSLQRLLSRVLLRLISGTPEPLSGSPPDRQEERSRRKGDAPTVLSQALTFRQLLHLASYYRMFCAKVRRGVRAAANVPAGETTSVPRRQEDGRHDLLVWPADRSASEQHCPLQPLASVGTWVGTQ